MSNIVVLYGNEPYLIKKYKQELTEQITMPEMNLYRTEVWDEKVDAFLNTFPLIDSFKLAIIECKDLKECEKKIESFLKHDSVSSMVCVIPMSCDKRGKVFKMLEKAGAICSCSKLSEFDAMQIISDFVGSVGGVIDKDALRLFMKKTNYSDEARSDINLLNLLSEMEKCVSYDTHVTCENVELLVKENLSSKVFQIAGFIQAGNLKALDEQAELLKGNEIASLSALLREYRIGWKSKYYSPSEIGVKFISLSKTDEFVLLEAIETIMEIIDGIKDGTIPEDNALRYAFLKLYHLHFKES